MISALTYVPRATPLGRAGPVAASAYLLSLAAAAFATSNPIVLAGVGAAVLVAGILGGAGRALALSARWGATLAVLVIATNAIASQRGDTVLVRGPEVPLLGTLDVSAEAIAEGAVLALRIAIVIAAFAVYTACVDPDRVLRLVRPVARRSALAASLIVRMVPLAAADQAQLREAAALRGPAAAPVGRAAMARRLVAGSLDRAVDVAATLELRGYAHGVPGRAARRPRSPAGAPFAVAALGNVALVIVALAGGVAGYESYPAASLDAGPATYAVAASLPLLAAAPFGVAGVRRRARRRPPRRLRSRGLARGGSGA